MSFDYVSHKFTPHYCLNLNSKPQTQNNTHIFAISVASSHHEFFFNYNRVSHLQK